VADPSSPPAEQGENRHERLNRELIELLNELRVALPGVQVLFAFLLSVPFSQRFTELNDTTTNVYFMAVLSSAIASILFIAPAAHHRIRFRDQTKEQLIRVANGMALVGTAFLAIALGAAVYVVGDLIYNGNRALIAAAVVTGGAALVWFAVPLLYRQHGDE
jgi:hypothetical protein